MILSKNFYSFTEAKRFYNYQMRIPQPYDIYLIEDHETDVYSVVSEGVYENLRTEYFLNMTVLSCTQGKAQSFNQ